LSRLGGTKTLLPVVRGGHTTGPTPNLTKKGYKTRQGGRDKYTIFGQPKSGTNELSHPGGGPQGFPEA